MPDVPSLDIIIVCWNHHATIGRCLGSLAEHRVEGVRVARVVVVDNGSTPPIAFADETRLPGLEVVANAGNRGFAAACNQGAAESAADYLLFLNPDTRLTPGVITGAIRALEQPSGCRTGIIGPRLVDEHGVVQATCGRFPGAANIFAQTTGLSRLAPRLFSGMRMTEWPHDDTRDVSFVSGACLFVRRTLFDALGGFDERLFVYLEDADLALRAAERGWRTRFVADLTVVHADGWSSGRDRARRLALSWRSQIVYGWKHAGVAGALAVTGTILLLAPFSRFAGAVLRRCPKDLLAAGPASVQLWGMLARELAAARSHRPDEAGANRNRSAGSVASPDAAGTPES